VPLFPDDPRQALRFRRSLLGAGGALMLSILLWIAGEKGMVRLTQLQLGLALAWFWTGILIFLGMLRSGFNLRFQEPSMTLPQIIWATLNVILMTYFLDQARPAALMVLLLVANFGSIRLSLAQLTGITILATASYGLVIYLLHLQHPERINLDFELIILAGFAIALYGTTLAGHEMHALRRALSETNRGLESALDQVNYRAVTDDLTGAYNRRYLDDVLAKQTALANRGDYRFSVCFFEVDQFKAIHDKFGHAVGDKVLVRVAGIADKMIREGDYLARNRGEDFVLVLAGTDAGAASMVAERTREAVAAAEFGEIEPGARVTLSCGVTEFRRGESVDALLTRADEGMSAAKSQGCNRVVYA
jgi:diguanylate cyclase (GGDEF)-like protein